MPSEVRPDAPCSLNRIVAVMPKRTLVEPSNTTFLVVTQWPHLVLWIHCFIAGQGFTNLFGGIIFIACYAISSRVILTSPSFAMLVAALGMWSVPHFGAFDGLSKAGYALATLCHFIRLQQITMDPDAFHGGVRLHSCNSVCHFRHEWRLIPDRHAVIYVMVCVCFPLRDELALQVQVSVVGGL
jgi:hypothetical protein